MVIKSIKRLILISFSLILLACSTVPERAEPWQSYWPPQATFELAYQADKDNQAVQSADEYTKWIRRFYEGWTFYPEGWDWLTDKVLSGIEDASERRLISEQMYSLGLRISKEWAKSSDYRVINTRHLLVWGNALKLSAAQNQELWLSAKVSADVDSLLALELKPPMIQKSRYYASNVPAASNVTADSMDEEDDFDI